MSNGLKPRKPQGSGLPKRQMMFVVYNHLKTPRYLGSMKPFSVSVSQDPLKKKTLPHMCFLYNLTSQTRHLATIVVFVPSSTSLLKLHLIYHVGSHNREFSLEHRFSLQKSNPTSRCPTVTVTATNPHMI